MTFTAILSVAEDDGGSAEPTNEQLGMSARQLYVGQDHACKQVRLAWNFDMPTNLIDWIGLYDQGEPNAIVTD